MENNLKSLDLERTVLAGILKNPEIFIDLSTIISNKDFSHPVHEKIFILLKNRLENKEKVDFVIITQKAAEIGLKFEQLDIGSYLENMYYSKINKDGIIEYVKELVKLRIRRELVENSEKEKKFVIENPQKNINEIISGVDLIHNERVCQFYNDDEPVDLFKNLEENIKEIAKNPKEETGLKTSFFHFNRLFGGLRAGNGVYNIISRASEGKSTFLFNMGLNISLLNNCKVLYLDSEMDENTNQFRALSSESQVGMWHLETGNWIKQKELIDRVESSFSKFNKLKGFIYHKNIANKPIQEILSIARKWFYSYVGRGNPAFIIYDYVKVMEDFGRKTEWQLVGDYISYLNELSLNLNVPVFTACQQNRTAQTENGRRDDSTTGSLSDRINWFVSHNAILRRKTHEEIEEHGEQNGTHLYLPFKTRFQGKEAYGHNEWVKEMVPDPKTHKLKAKYRQNFINYEIKNFKVIEKNTFEDILKQKNASHNLQPTNKDGFIDF